MGQGTDHKLAQRVAAMGESARTKLPVQATSSASGKTYHHDVYLVQPDVAVAKMQKMVGKTAQPIVQIDKTPGSWYMNDFMKGSGPLSIDFGSGWTLVNADEIRDALVSQQRSSGEQSFSESKKGLWHNIQQKRKRMGKNYKPAKPGEKGRPGAKAWKNAQE
jgi:cellobiose-specific phosphotransferase system component IIB